ncbi:DNA-deoxyinosine glycosylase [Nitrosomonas sp.]|uniref:DNA-deoxyinosine glycosylase n=1 Tax=Nitrosomonas sp. TaxID=42353 RepID=UPI001E0F46EC|nr:DNA-deoxyinosine glycosylase [Nitrosomonas sp.]MCB1948189.1 DNA-deoxyinosine glycosylase [Nitrosomonas sp.]MDR4514603.1 DNA-deoxyinosine glycosylase [Nitrosomonas sp.]
MDTLYSFAPIVQSDAEILILGSMPGRASLEANQYYAHPHNAFWRIMGELLGFDSRRTTYPEKTNALKSARIALWDVLQSCRRKGSLDSSIEIDSQTINDFPAFFATYPQIRAVFFNGAKAEDCFRRYVLKKHMPALQQQIQLTRLPSTSPAHAALSFAEKREQWANNITGRIMRHVSGSAIMQFNEMG